MRITIQPIVAETIYITPTSIEEYASKHPESSVNFLLENRNNKKIIEPWTFLQPEAATAWHDLQADWKNTGGELYISDCLRQVKEQIELKKKKPTLAVKPGWSFHNFGAAIDFDTSRLGKGKTLAQFQKHVVKYGWTPISSEAWHIQYKCLYEKYENIPNIKASDQYFIELAKRELPLTGEDIKTRLMQLGYANSDEISNIRSFQNDVGLTPDGYVGSKTSMTLVLCGLQYERV